MKLPDNIERDLQEIETDYVWRTGQQAGVPRLRSLRSSIQIELQKLGYRYKACLDRNNWRLEDGRVIGLLTPEDLENTPDGTLLYDIEGNSAVVGKDEIDNDVRYGYLAYGKLRDEG